MGTLKNDQSAHDPCLSFHKAPKKGKCTKVKRRLYDAKKENFHNYQMAIIMY